MAAWLGNRQRVGTAGGPVPAPQSPQAVVPCRSWQPAFGARKPTSKLALVSALLMALGFTGAGIVSWPAAIVVGILALKETGKSGTYEGRGMAWAGIIGGVMAPLLFVAAVAAILAVADSFAYNPEDEVLTPEAIAANTDYELIAKRLQAYALKHDSIYVEETGGDAGTSGNGHAGGPRVRSLTLHDLVRPDELLRPIEDYRMTTGDGSSSKPNWIMVENPKAKRSLDMTDVRGGIYRTHRYYASGW